MFTTSFGEFNGKSWEALCQQVFKMKYGSDGYQQIPASPGDFGLEGFTLKTGFGFQCYCPEKHYTRQELYDAQRDKITKDLGKLRTYQADLAKLLGSTKLGHWVFVTPEVDKHSLLAHARTKEVEVQGWSIPFLLPDFRILLHDGDHYLLEINEILSAAGEALNFDKTPPKLPELSEPPEVYERNIRRKCEVRLTPKKISSRYTHHVERLHQQTLESFLEADDFFRRIEASAPIVYIRLVRLINEYEKYLLETQATWTDTADALTIKVSDGLAERVARDLAPEFDDTHARMTARHMVARWLAICELDYD
jgi:hypothetical protein